jgi:tape measure domain-containing protein
MATTLGSLILELGIDDSKIGPQLEAARKKALTNAAQIERDLKRLNINDAIKSAPEIDNSGFTPTLDKLDGDVDRVSTNINKRFSSIDATKINESLHLKPTVDHSELTALNEHLDLKLKHVLDLNNNFAFNPLKVRVDDRAIDDSTDKLKGFAGGSYSVEVRDAGVDSVVRDVKQELSLGLGADIGQLSTVVEDLRIQNSGLMESNQTLALALRGLNTSVQANSEVSKDMPVKMSKIIHTSSKESLGDKIIGLPARMFEMVFTGAVEGIGQQLSYDFARGTQKYVEKKTGVDAETLGYNFGRFGYNRTKGMAMVGAEALGYRGGLKEVGDDLSYLAKKLDNFLDPRKLVSRIKGFEDLVVATLEDVHVYNDPERAGRRVQEYFKPEVEEVKEGVARAAGVGLRAVATPFRIRKRANLAQSMEYSKVLAESMEVPDIPDVENKKAIALVSGGVDLKEGGPNTYMANAMLKNLLGDQVATVPVPNAYSNDKDMMGAAKMLRQILANVAADFTGNEEMRSAGDTIAMDRLYNIAYEAGFNPDAIAMEATRLAYEKKYEGQNKKFIFAGTSAGTTVAEEAVAISERAGAKNVKGFGATLPLAGLTNTASKENFKAFVGTLDPMFLALMGKRLTNEDAESKGTLKILEASLAHFPGILQTMIKEKWNSGLMAPSSNTEVIEGAGLLHNLGPFLANDDFQVKLEEFLGIQLSDDAKGRAGQSANKSYADMFGELDALSRTLRALQGDQSAVNEIKEFEQSGGEKGGYAFVTSDLQFKKSSGPAQEKYDLEYALDNFKYSGKHEDKNVKELGKGPSKMVKGQALEDANLFQTVLAEMIDLIQASSADLAGQRENLARTFGILQGNEADITDAQSGKYAYVTPEGQLKKSFGESQEKYDLEYAVDEFDTKGDAELEKVKSLMQGIIDLTKGVDQVDDKKLSSLSDRMQEMINSVSEINLAEVEKLMAKLGEIFGVAPNMDQFVAQDIEDLAQGRKTFLQLQEEMIARGENIPEPSPQPIVERESNLPVRQFATSETRARDAQKLRQKDNTERLTSQKTQLRSVFGGDADLAADLYPDFNSETFAAITNLQQTSQTNAFDALKSMVLDANIQTLSLSPVNLERPLVTQQPERIPVEIMDVEEATNTGREIALSFVQGVGTGLANVAESAGEALGNAAESKLVGLVNKLMRRVPGDPESLDANAPTIASLSDIGPEQIAKASALGIEDAASVLGSLSKAGMSAAKALIQVSKSVGVQLQGAQPAANEFIEGSRKKLNAAKGLLSSVQSSLATSTPDESVINQVKMLSGDPNASDETLKQGYVTKLLTEVNSAIARLSPEDRTKPVEGNQLANLKSQIVKIESQLQELAVFLTDIQSQDDDVIEGEIVQNFSDFAGLPASPQQQVRQLTAAQPPPDYEKMVKKTSDDFAGLRRIVENKKGQYSQEDQSVAASEIMKVADEAYEAIGQLQEQLGDRATTPFKNLSRAAKGQITQAKNLVTRKADAGEIDISDQVASLGQDVVKGFPEGFSDRISALKAESTRLVEGGIIDPMAKGLKIQSPSKVTEYFGRMTGEGFIKGIASTLSSAEQVIKDLYSMADMYQGNLRKAFDMSVVTDELAILRDSVTEALTLAGQLEDASGAIQNATTAVGRIVNYPNEAIVSKYKEDVRSNAQRVLTDPRDPDTHPAANNIPADAKKVIFVSSGFTGTKGRISNEIAGKLENMAPKGTHMVPFENKNFDVSGTLDEAGIARVVMDAIIMPMKAVKQGFNEEALRLAKQAYAVKQDRPNVEIGFVGHSAGGFIVREAQEILRGMEIFSQALSIGTPLLGAFQAVKPNTVSIMGEGDPLRRFTGQKEAIMPGVKGHFSPEYLDNSNEMQEVLTKYLEEGITPGLIARIHELGSVIKGLEPGKSGPVMQFERMRSGGSQRSLPEGSAIGSSSVGQNIGKGLAIGIDNGAKAAIEAANHMADAVIDITEATFEVNSPSEWGKRVGGFLTQGIALGITATKNKVGNAIKGVKESTSKSFDNWVNTPTEDDFVPIEWNTKRPEADIPIIGPAYAGVLDMMENMKNMATALPEIGRGLAGVFEGVMQNTPAIMNMAKGFLVFSFIVKPLIATLAAFEEASFNVAVEMQNMSNVIKLVSGSAAEGAKNIAFVRQQVSAMGGDMRAGMQGFAQLGASAQGTRLEGEGTRQVFSAVSQAAVIYQMDPEEQGRAYTALSQMMDKSVVSAEELRGQLAESLPGAIAVAARAMGVSTQELGKMMEMGEVMAEDLLPRFAQQLSAETAGGVAGSAKTAQYAINKLNNEMLLLQEAYGQTSIPIRIAGMEVASAGLKAIRENILALSVAVTAVVFALLKNAAIETVKFLAKFAKIEAVMNMIRNAAMALFPKLIAMVKQLGMAFLKQFLVLIAVGDLFTIIGKGFGDASGGMQDTADSTVAAWESYVAVLEAANKAQEDLDKGKPKGPSFERFKEKGGLDALKGMARSAGPLGYVKSIGSAVKGLDGSAGSYGTLGKSILGTQQIIDVSKDAKKFFDAFVDGIGISDELKSLMKDESLVESTLIGSVFGKELSRVFENGMHQVLGSIQGAGGLIGGALNMMPGMGMIRSVGGMGMDLGRTYGDMQREQRDIAVGDQVFAGGKIQEEAQATLFNAEGKASGDLKRIIELDAQYRSAQQRRSALPREDVEGQRKLEEEINAILAERGGIYTNVGKQQANLQLSVENYKAQIKSVKEEIATLGNSDADNERRTQLEGQLAALEANMTGSQKILDRINVQLGEAANRVELLARQFRAVNAELQNANYNLELQAAQQQASIANNIGPGQTGLKEGTNNFVQQQQTTDKIAANQNFIQQTQGILNDTAYIEALENAGLSATSTAADIAAKVEELSDSSLKDTLSAIQGTKEQLEQTTLETAQLEGQLAELKDQLEEQIFQMQVQIEDMLIEVTNQAEEIGLRFKEAQNDRKINEASGVIGRALSKFRGTFFSGFMDVLQEFIGVLQEEMKNTADYLRQKMELSQQLFQQLRANEQFNLGIPAVDGSAAGPGSGGGAAFASPIAGKSIQELVNYRPSPGQSFTAYRNRRSGPDVHGGIDWDSRVGGGAGAQVNAVQGGTAEVIRIGQSAEGGSVQVRIKFTDEQGRPIQHEYNHLSESAVRQALGVGPGGGTVQVAAGQRLGAVGPTDNLSSGAHLDYKVRINGQAVDPQQYLSALANGGGTARTIGGGSIQIAAPRAAQAQAAPQQSGVQAFQSYAPTAASVAQAGAGSGRINTQGLTVKGQQVSDSQFQYARVIARVGQQLGATADEIRVAIATAIQESTLRNLGGGDRDSAGLFQQRPSMDWGSIDQVTNPEAAARSFYAGIGTNIGLLDTRGRSNDLYQRSNMVQRSAHPDAPRRWDAEAQRLAQTAIAANSGSSTNPQSAREGNQSSPAVALPPVPRVDVTAINQQTSSLRNQSGQVAAAYQQNYNDNIAVLDQIRSNQQLLANFNFEQIVNKFGNVERQAQREQEDTILRNRRAQEDAQYNNIVDKTPEVENTRSIQVAERGAEDVRIELTRTLEDARNDRAVAQQLLTQLPAVLQANNATPQQQAQILGSLQNMIATFDPIIASTEQALANVDTNLAGEIEKLRTEQQRAEEDRLMAFADTITAETGTLMRQRAEVLRRTDPVGAETLINQADAADEVQANKSLLLQIERDEQQGILTPEEANQRREVAMQNLEVALQVLGMTLEETTKELQLYNTNALGDSSREVRAQTIQELRFNGDPVEALRMEQEDALGALLQEFESRRLQIQTDLQLDQATRDQLLADLEEIEASTIEMVAKLDVRAQVQLEIDNDAALLEGRAANLEALIPNLNANYESGQARDMQAELDALNIELGLRQRLQEISNPENGLTAEIRERLKLLAEETAMLQGQNLEREHALQVLRDQNEIAQNALSGPGGELDRVGAAQGYASMFGFQDSYGMRQLALPSQLEQQNLSFQAQLIELEELRNAGKLTQEAFEGMRESLEDVNNVKLETIRQQASQLPEVMSAIRGPTQSLFSDLLRGTKTVGEAFAGFIGGLADNIAQFASDQLTDLLFGKIFGGGIGSLFGGEEEETPTGPQSGIDGAIALAESVWPGTAESADPGTSLVTGANEAGRLVAQSGEIFLQSVQQAASMLQQASFGTSGGPMTFGSSTFSFLGGGGNKAASAANRGFSVDTNNLNLSFDRGARSLGDAIVNSSNKGGNLFSNALSGIFGSGRNGGGGLLGGLLGGGGGSGGGGGGILGSVLQFGLGLFGFADGGDVAKDGFKIPNFSGGGALQGISNEAVKKAYNREKPHGRPVLAMLNDNEWVLNRKQQAIAKSMGVDEKILNFSGGGVVGGSNTPSITPNIQQTSGGNTTNSVSISVNNTGPDLNQSALDQIMSAVDSKINKRLVREKKSDGLFGGR